MKVLVTGGAGYIGAHACKYLHQRGLEVVVLDNLSTGHRDFVRWGPLEQGSTGDVEFVRAVLRRHRPTGVIHFAASSLVAESVARPDLYWINNVTGTLGLLQAMVAEKVNNIIFSSTAAVYGTTEVQPIPESCATAPQNPYGTTKNAIEQMLAEFEAAYGLRWGALRYFNAAGADFEAEIGEDHWPETHLIPNALSALDSNTSQLRIFGTDYETADGTCVRDYVHVVDLADAHFRALRHLDEGNASGVFNLGSGCGFSVKEIARTVERVTGRQLRVEHCARRPGDPPVLIAANDKAREVLGWTPRHSDPDTIIRTAWDWHQVLRERSALRLTG